MAARWLGFRNVAQSHLALRHTVVRLSVSASHKADVQLQENEVVSNDKDPDKDQFPVYVIHGLKKVERTNRRTERRTLSHGEPRFKEMATDQDWTNVWPTARTFNWSSVPLPVRQGYVKNSGENSGIVPGKYANAELMKIPNFLHLSPAHIKKQCAAIKKFCTDWPQALYDKDTCEKNFPMTVITSNYCQAGPSIRDVRARVVTIKVQLSSLNLDGHARDKMIRLSAQHYNKETDTLTITADRCPMRKQNYDYAIYLLTVLYHESQKTEPWEAQKTVADHDKFYWDYSASKKNVVQLISKLNQDSSRSPDYVRQLKDGVSEADLVSLQPVKDYGNAVTDLCNSNEGNYERSLDTYKDSVLRLLDITPDRDTDAVTNFISD